MKNSNQYDSLDLTQEIVLSDWRLRVTLNKTSPYQRKKSQRPEEVLQEQVIESPKKVEEEIFQDIDKDGFNQNSSEQLVYPGLQIHKTDTATKK